MTLGVKLGDSTNARISTLIGVIIMIGSYGILIFFSNYYLVLLGMGIFGLGDGLGNLSAIKNAWKYFPNNKGLVNGIIIGGLGLSSSFFTPLADYIINKNGIKTDDDGFYDKEIANRLIYFLYVMIGIFGFLGFFAIVFTFPYQEENSILNNDEGYEKEKLIQDDDDNEKGIYENGIQNRKYNKNDNNETNNKNDNNENNNKKEENNNKSDNNENNN